MATEKSAIVKLKELGFHICPWEVTHRDFRGATQMEKKGAPFDFYVGLDELVGHYCFLQPWKEHAMLFEEDLREVLSAQGITPLHVIRDSEPSSGVFHYIGVKGKDVKTVYQTLQRIEQIIQKELNLLLVL